MRNRKYILLTLLPILFLACAKNNGTDEVAESILPDTSHIPELINFLEDNQLDAIINEELPLRNGKPRPTGIKAVPQPGDDFRRAQLDEIYWTKVKVFESDFRGASIRSGKCQESDFHDSDFRAADIRWTIFDDSDMRDINFDQSRLFHVHVNRANLDGSTFRGANMFGMEGHFAKMRNCDFTGALMKDSEFVEADWTGSTGVKTKLFRAVLKDSKIDSCDLSFSDFTGAGLEGSSFKGTKLIGCNFQGGHLQGADFSGADLRDCNFFGTEFEGTNFAKAKNIPKSIKGFIDDKGMATGIWQDAGKSVY